MEVRDSHGSWPVRETPTVDLVGGAAARARQNLIGGVCRVVAWLPHGESVAFGQPGAAMPRIPLARPCPARSRPRLRPSQRRNGPGSAWTRASYPDWLQGQFAFKRSGLTRNIIADSHRSSAAFSFP